MIIDTTENRGELTADGLRLTASGLGPVGQCGGVGHVPSRRYFLSAAFEKM
jgi:hypothetical protein